jgi:hypothetical protein
MSFSNLLLQQLTDADHATIGALDLVNLHLHDQLESPNATVEFVYFPETVLLSVVGTMNGRSSTEVGMIGFEGMSGVTVILGGTQSPLGTVVQAAGTAFKLPASRFVAALARKAALRTHFQRYAQAFAAQAAATAIANGRFKLPARLARWLLMTGDRLGDKYAITHEYISVMLAVRRSGVTLGLQALEGAGLIRSTRGLVIIINRNGLIETAAGSYGMPEGEYRRLFGADLQD